MKTYKFIRLDKMSGNRDMSQVYSGVYFKDGKEAEVENGTIVAIKELLDGHRELHKVEDVADSDVLVGIITTPEVLAEERGYVGIENFINEEKEPVRVHILHEGDIFSIGNSTDTENLAMGAKLIGKHIQTEQVGRFPHQVYQVQAL